MINREYTLSDNNSLSGRKKRVKPNSIDILEQFIEILPKCSGGKNSKRIYKYKRIKTEELTKARIKDIFRKKGFKKLPDIIKVRNNLKIQFENKPALEIISGRIYVKKKELEDWKTPIRFCEHQASILLDVLRDYVECFSYTTYHIKQRIPFLEDEGNGSS